MSDEVLIVGYSGRAAAGSARRAGVTPIIVDCFADRDTAAYCEVYKCPPEHFPHGLLPIIEKMPKRPVIFTGGMEHEPELIEAIRGPSPLTTSYVNFVKKVRDVQSLQSCQPRPMRDVLYPANFSTKAAVPHGVEVLEKPFKSGGGRGIHKSQGENPKSGTYLQEFIPGTPMSMSFRSARDDGDNHHFPIVRQLSGCEWLHGSNFEYCGNICHRTVSEIPECFRDLLDYKNSLEKDLNCRLLWGIDFIYRDQVIHITEVNPRYPASIEVLEHTHGVAILSHDIKYNVPPGIVGKAIWYAPFDLIVPESAAFDEAVAVAADPWALPMFADIPHVGERIAKGTPVVTILTRQADEDAVMVELKRKAANLDELFEGCRA